MQLRQEFNFAADASNGTQWYLSLLLPRNTVQAVLGAAVLIRYEVSYVRNISQSLSGEQFQEANLYDAFFPGVRYRKVLKM